MHVASTMSTTRTIGAYSVDHRGFDAMDAGAAVQHHGHGRAQVVHHVLCCRGAGAPRPVPHSLHVLHGYGLTCDPSTTGYLCAQYRLAEGAASGNEHNDASALMTVCPGSRMAAVGWQAVTMDGKIAGLGHSTVSGPGQ